MAQRGDRDDEHEDIEMDTPPELADEPTATPDSDRPGIARQASKVPEEVRAATTILDSDESYALLITIAESGTTRFTWLFQELAIPNQEIVERLGDLYTVGLVEVTKTGKGEGKETAYELTDFGAALLDSLQHYDEPDEDEDESEPLPLDERPKHPDPYPNSDRVWLGVTRRSGAHTEDEDDDPDAVADIELKQPM